MTTQTQIGEIAMILLSFRDQLKIYHWQTTSYSRHKASDKLVDIMTSQIDKFMETLQGSRNLRMIIPDKNSITFQNQNTLLLFLSPFWRTRTSFLFASLVTLTLERFFNCI